MDLNKYKILFNYLYLKSDEILTSDYIIGFGHFDLNIPEKCGQLYLKKYAPQIIFTGGFGAGSADFKLPEAQTFFNYIIKKFPMIPQSNIHIEDQSTNTSENVSFIFDNVITHKSNINSIIIVANGYRQRRVYLTCIQQFPHITFINCPPETTYEKEMALFKSKGEDLNILLIGEIDRLILYCKQGYISEPNITEDILKIYWELKKDH